MNHLVEGSKDLFEPGSLTGALFFGVLFLLLASLVAMIIRRGAHRIERGLSDATSLQFASVFAQWLAYLIAFVLYAHLVPPLRALGTALLAGAGVASVVAGLAAQDTLGNLIAGCSLVLSRTIQIGDSIHLYCPVGTITARVKAISLAFTLLVNDENNEVVVPNSVVMNSAIVRIRAESSVSSASAPDA